MYNLSSVFYRDVFDFFFNGCTPCIACLDVLRINSIFEGGGFSVEVVVSPATTTTSVLSVLLSAMSEKERFVCILCESKSESAVCDACEDWEEAADELYSTGFGGMCHGDTTNSPECGPATQSSTVCSISDCSDDCDAWEDPCEEEPYSRFGGMRHGAVVLPCDGELVLVN